MTIASVTSPTIEMNQTRSGYRSGPRENSEGKKPSQTRAPASLKPVHPPSKRDLNSSIEVVPFNDYMNSGGYSSPGQDSDSTRISNLKYTGKQAVTNRDSQVSTALSKITKLQPVMNQQV